MQTLLTYLTLLLTGLLMQAQNTIKVSMSGFENNDGTVMVGLYNSEENFLDKIYMRQTSRIVNRTSTVIFENIPDGVYAISCYQDEDNNGELNKRFGFIPIESFGTSNNASARFGPPEWDDAKFAIMNDQDLSMNIKFNN